MAVISLPTIRGGGNLHRLCPAPWDCRRPRGTVAPLAGSSPVFPHRVQPDVPDNPRFLGRPRLLTRSGPLPTGRAKDYLTT